MSGQLSALAQLPTSSKIWNEKELLLQILGHKKSGEQERESASNQMEKRERKECLFI